MSEENTTETNRKPNPNNIPQPGDDGRKRNQGLIFIGYMELPLPHYWLESYKRRIARRRNI